MLFFINWGTIQETLNSTKFRELWTDRQKPAVGAPGSTVKPPVPPVTIEDAPPAAAPPAAAPPTAAPPTATPPAAAPPTAAPPTATPPTATPPTATPPTATPPTAAPPAAAPKPADKQPVVAPTSPAPKPATTPSVAVRTRDSVLFFIKIDDDGVITRQEVKRTIAAGDSPLTDSLGALLRGPNENELRRGLISLVPQGSKLLSAHVRDGTAYLSFNEAFMYNKYGIEGYAGQLKQIVYTATAFPTVRDVQILIEGRTVDYLGGEGVYIGKPLSRTSF